MTKAFKITSPHKSIQMGTFHADNYTFMCNVRHHINKLTFAFRDKQNVWHEYELPCTPNKWVDNASVDFTLTEEMTAFSLCAKDASVANPVFIQSPFLELANNKGAYGNNVQDYIESLEQGFSQENIDAVLAGGKLSVSGMSEDKANVQFKVPLYNAAAARKRWDIAKNKSKPNYIPYGFWNIDTKYTRTDFGIPFVKVGTPEYYFVYSLQVQSSIGKNPTMNFGDGKDWKLVESLEFIFMQQAYIEQLQAELVTAERIEAMDITVKRLMTPFTNLPHSDALYDTSRKVYKIMNDLNLSSTGLDTPDRIVEEDWIELPDDASYIGTRIVILNSKFPPYTYTQGSMARTVVCVSTSSKDKQVGVGGEIRIGAIPNSTPDPYAISFMGRMVEFICVPRVTQTGTIGYWIVSNWANDIIKETWS